MIPRFLNWLSLRLPGRAIRTREGRIYLARFRLFGEIGLPKPGEIKPARGARLSAFLHRFMLPDPDRSLHSHPWRFGVSLVLWGGYTEERVVGWKCGMDEPCFAGCAIVKRIRRRPFTLNFFTPNTLHRIVELHGSQTWSLFIAGPKWASWGFLTDEGMVSHHDYLQNHPPILELVP